MAYPINRKGTATTFSTWMWKRSAHASWSGFGEKNPKPQVRKAIA